jgi:hypothetical protein
MAGGRLEGRRMIRTLVSGAAWADDWLDRRLGRPYAIILIIGIVAEIGRRIAELLEHRPGGAGLASFAWLLVLNGALLIHQLAGLHHIHERRLAQASRGAADAAPLEIEASAASEQTEAPAGRA